MLPLNARVKVLERSKGFIRIAPAGFVFAGHLAPHRDQVDVGQRERGVQLIAGEVIE